MGPRSFASKSQQHNRVHELISNGTQIDLQNADGNVTGDRACTE